MKALSLLRIVIILAVISLFNNLSYAQSNTENSGSSFNIFSYAATNKHNLSYAIKSVKKANVVYTYYSPGLLESKTFRNPDKFGNVYYHYINERLPGLNHGRVDMLVMVVPDSDGAVAYKYEYYDNTATIKTKYCYQTADYSDPSNPLLINLIVAYEYYSSSNLKSRTLTSPDENSNIKYEYCDENFYGNNTGRLQKVTKANGSYEVFIDYWDGTDRVKVKETYDAATGQIYSYTYYAANLLESKITMPPWYGYNPVEYVHYINENWNGQGYGRIDIKIDKTGGQYGFKYEYHEGTDIVKAMYRYDDGCDFSDPSNPVLGHLDTTVTYYRSGRTESTYSPEIYPNIYSHYIDEEWYYPGGPGRLDMLGLAYVREGARALRYEYHENSVYPKATYYYENADYTNLSNPLLINLILAYTFYADRYQGWESRTFSSPDSDNNLYYHYINEERRVGVYWIGRLDTVVMAEPDNDGAIAYKYEYYDGTAQIKTKYCYGSADYTDPSNPIPTNLIAKYEYEPSGNLAVKYEYFSSGNLKSKTLQSPDDDGNVKYEYFDENFYGNHIGRLSMIWREDTSYGRISYDPFYNDDWHKSMYFFPPMDGREPVLKYISLPNGTKLDLFNYSAIYIAYYDSGNIDGIVIWPNSTPDAQFMMYYYAPLDEALYQTPFGFMGRIGEEALIAQDPSVPHLEPYKYSYSYWGSSDILKIKKIYTEGSFAGLANKLSEQIEYDANGNEICRTTYEYSSHEVGSYNRWDCLISKTLTTPDENGNIKYEYYDEKFYRGVENVYGRLYKVTKQDGSCEVFAEYWEGTDKVKTKNLYDASGSLIETQEYDIDGNIINKLSSQANSDATIKLTSDITIKQENATTAVGDTAVLEKIAVIESGKIPLPSGVSLTGSMANKESTITGLKNPSK